MTGQDHPGTAGALATVPQQVFGSSPFANLRGFAQQPAFRKSLPAIGMIGAAGLSLLAWSAFQSPAQRTIFEGLADADKSAVLDALQSAGIDAQVASDSGAVEVAEGDVHRARILLAGQGLPKAAPAGDALVSAIPMGSSRAVEGETLRAAREADLARTIEAIDPVKRARVHLAMSQPSPFVRDETPPSASIMLTLQNGRTVSEAQARAIRHLVAASVPGLAPAQVSIVDQSGSLLSQSGDLAGERSFELQRLTEERTRQALHTLLAPVVGIGNFTAEVHADIDVSESQSTRESFPENDRALRSEQGNRSNTSSSLPAAIGIPGALSNQPPPPSQLTTTPPAVQPPAAPAAGSDSNETFSRSFDVGREISVTHKPQGRLSKLSVAVALRNMPGQKPRSKVELAAIEALVKGAVGFDAARGDAVIVSARPFAETQEAAASWWDKPWLLPLARQIGALLAGLLVLVFIGRPLMRMLRERANRPPAERPAEALLGQPVTLDMIEKAPSYEARAALVRGYVDQDRGRAALVVKQLVAGDGR